MQAGIYAQGAAAQWDPATAIPWNADFDLPLEVEDAVVQIMTYLIENETAALLVPSRFVSQIHPHFREVMQVLALQAADEARHIEVFTRRALLKRKELGLSTAGGQASLKTLVEEPDFAVASFLAVRAGRGHFPVAALVPRPARARPCHRRRMSASRRRTRLGTLPSAWRICANTSRTIPAFCRSWRMRSGGVMMRCRIPPDLNAEVFDALLLVAAGGWELADLSRGHHALTGLVKEMDERRQSRMLYLGFGDREARELSSLHTRNFM